MKLKPVPLMFLTFKSTSAMGDNNFYWFHFFNYWIISSDCRPRKP